MSDTLRNRTARSAIFVVRESLKSLRQYSADLTDPANIDRVIKTAEVLSTSLKKLEPFLDGPASGQTTDTPLDALISVQTVARALSAVQDGLICAECGGIRSGEQTFGSTFESSPDHKHTVEVGTPERAKARNAATEDEYI